MFIINLIFQAFLHQKNDFSCTKFTLPSYYNVYIMYEFSPNSVVSVRCSSITHFLIILFYRKFYQFASKFDVSPHNDQTIYTFLASHPPSSPQLLVFPVSTRPVRQDWSWTWAFPPLDGSACHQPYASNYDGMPAECLM